MGGGLGGGRGRCFSNCTPWRKYLVGAYLLPKEGRTFYLMTHSEHFIYGHMASDIIMVKDHSDSERGNLLLSLHGYAF